MYGTARSNCVPAVVCDHGFATFLSSVLEMSGMYRHTLEYRRALAPYSFLLGPARGLIKGLSRRSLPAGLASNLYRTYIRFSTPPSPVPRGVSSDILTAIALTRFLDGRRQIKNICMCILLPGHARAAHESPSTGRWNRHLALTTGGAQWPSHTL